MKRALGIGFFCMCLAISSFAQKAIYRNSFRIGFGYGSYANANVEGRGTLFNFGFLRTLKNERLRLNPYISSGGYGAKNLDGVRDQWFTSTNIGCNIWYDVVDETGFALVLGSGLLANRTNGLLGHEPATSTSAAVDSKYVKDMMVGGYLGAGLRIKNYDGRFNIELLPLNFHFGKMGYLDLYSSVNVNIVF